MPPSRNQACPCGSGKKYKHCCASNIPSPAPQSQPRGWIRLENGQLVPAAQAMAHAIQLHQAGRIRKAEAIYQQVVQQMPGNADAQHLLGLVYHQTGKHALAYAHISRAISLDPKGALFHNNLGEVCRALNRPEEAQACYARALALQPTMLEPQRNIGLTLLEQNRPEEAEAHLRQLIARHPKYPGGHQALAIVLVRQNKAHDVLAACDEGLRYAPLDLALLHAKGQALKRTGQADEAARHYRQAIERQPNVPDLYRYLAVVLLQLGDSDGAVESLKNEIRLRPGDASAQHLLASLQSTTTDRAPAAYVSELFNTYADIFDQHLVGKLDYQTHVMMAQMVRDALGTDAHGLDILDLGCGTGLLGEEIKDIAGSLVGIDLASKMIDQARQRGIYSELILGDLVDYLAQAKPGQFDLIAATDVFIYLGNLAPIFREISRILEAGGRFAFSLEAAPENGDDFVLGRSGRYQHSRAYVERLGADAQFKIDRFTHAVIRKDQNQPVAGYLYVLAKTSGSVAVPDSA